jgi:cation diffusion facilitator family transporter
MKAVSSPTTSQVSAQPVDNRFLERFLWLSILTAILTVGIKGAAAVITNSVGLWSDALESLVNLVAAIVALWAIKLAVKPADHNHDFGHGKAEYMSAAVEGTLIFIAAGAIIYGAVLRLLSPVEPEQLGLGLALSLVASLLNLGTGMLLLRAGVKHRSITLEADGKHLLTDVWTSAGVLVAIGLVALTGWTILDPIIAILVGLNILFTGYGLVKRSVVGLLDSALPAEELEIVNKTVADACNDDRVQISQLRTRESGRQRFVYATLAVPGEWTVRRSHDVADEVETAVDRALPGTTTFVHIEPVSEAPATV